MKCRRACAIQLREEVLPAIRTHVPFDVEHPGRESFPSPLQGREDILEKGNPDRLQDGIHGISTYNGVSLVVLTLAVFLDHTLRLVSFVEEKYTLLSSLGQWINWGLVFLDIWGSTFSFFLTIHSASPWFDVAFL